MKYSYSPHTFELINIETPSDRMLTTDIIPPDYNNQISGCFFRNGSWIIETSIPDTSHLSKSARSIRDGLITKTQSRINRALRHIRNGLTPIDNVTKLDTYIQELSEIPSQSGFPITIDWPIAP